MWAREGKGRRRKRERGAPKLRGRRGPRPLSALSRPPPALPVPSASSPPLTRRQRRARCVAGEGMGGGGRERQRRARAPSAPCHAGQKNASLKPVHAPHSRIAHRGTASDTTEQRLRGERAVQRGERGQGRAGAARPPWFRGPRGRRERDILSPPRLPFRFPQRLSPWSRRLRRRSAAAAAAWWGAGRRRQGRRQRRKGRGERTRTFWACTVRVIQASMRWWRRGAGERRRRAWGERENKAKAQCGRRLRAAFFLFRRPKRRGSARDKQTTSHRHLYTQDVTRVQASCACLANQGAGAGW